MLGGYWLIPGMEGREWMDLDVAGAQRLGEGAFTQISCRLKAAGVWIRSERRPGQRHATCQSYIRPGPAIA